MSTFFTRLSPYSTPLSFLEWSSVKLFTAHFYLSQHPWGKSNACLCLLLSCLPTTLWTQENTSSFTLMSCISVCAWSHSLPWLFSVCTDKLIKQVIDLLLDSCRITYTQTHTVTRATCVYTHLSASYKNSCAAVCDSCVWTPGVSLLFVNSLVSFVLLFSIFIVFCFSRLKSTLPGIMFTS